VRTDGCSGAAVSACAGSRAGFGGGRELGPEESAPLPLLLGSVTSPRRRAAATTTAPSVPLRPGSLPPPSVSDPGAAPCTAGAEPCAFTLAGAGRSAARRGAAGSTVPSTASPSWSRLATSAPVSAFGSPCAATTGAPPVAFASGHESPGSTAGTVAVRRDTGARSPAGSRALAGAGRPVASATSGRAGAGVSVAAVVSAAPPATAALADGEPSTGAAASGACTAPAHPSPTAAGAVVVAAAASTGTVLGTAEGDTSAAAAAAPASERTCWSAPGAE